jgi:iron(III) transport system substrate-binding protein
VSDNIKRGERIIAVGALDSYAADDRRAGHPITTIFPADGTFIIPSPTSIIKGSPNPNAAKLFAEYMIGDAVQKLFPDDGGYAARSDMPAPKDSPAIGQLKVLPVDYDYIEKESARIKKQFNEIFQ